MGTKTTSTGLSAPTPAQRALTVGLWVLQALVAFQFIGGGLMKLSGAPVMVDMFDTFGIGQWFRFVVGTLEILGAVGLLIPRIAGFAALGLSCLMIGAITTNMLILHADSGFAIALLVMCALIVWGRWTQIGQLFAQRGR